MRILFMLLMSIGIFLSGCSIINPPQEHSFSFEENLEGWQVKRCDIQHPPDTIAWHIQRTDSASTDGSYSLEFFLDNWNDAGKIWIQREFSVDLDQEYKVKLSFDFASSDFTQTNLFKIVAGAGASPPASPEEIAEAMQEDTYNGGTQDWVWMEKDYQLEASPDSEGKLYVFLGVWGTWETPRTYYVDEVRVDIR